MKIWCDVCDKEEAVVFCCADEAALCNSCDRHVHFANKLAGKHLRFSLASPTFKDAPLCDICQERRALLFCQEDRAILCRQCDIPIHQANDHTKSHNRFLLTGVKLSSSPSPYPKASDSTSVPALIRSNPPKTRPKSVSSQVPSSASNEIFTRSPSTTTNNCYYGFEENCHQTSDSGSGSGTGSGSGSGSISEYLMETLPGWRVEDLLDHPSCDYNITNGNSNNEFYSVCDGSSQYHHHGFWEQKPFS